MSIVHGTLMESVLAGQPNTDEEWLEYFRTFHELLPNANDLFALLRTRTNDTSYTIVAKSVSSAVRDVLDLACGDGNLIDDLLVQLPNARIYGVDVCAAEIAIARGRFADESRVTLDIADAAALPYDDNSFDCVIAHQFLNFLPDIQRYLREIARVLKPGGRLLSVSNRGWQSDREAIWIKINEAAFDAVKRFYPEVVWPKMGDMRFYRENGVREVFAQSTYFDAQTFSTGSFVSSVMLTPDRVAAIYNRLYFYGLLAEKKHVLEAVTERAKQLAKGDLVEMTLPFRLVSVRVKG